MSFVEPVEEPSPFRRTLMVSEAIAARWRAIVLLFILAATIWLALQAFVVARDALHNTYVSARESVPNLNELPRQIAPNFSLAPPPITNCWRDRSLVAGDCFKSSGAEHRPPERPRAPRPRFPGCCRTEI